MNLILLFSELIIITFSFITLYSKYQKNGLYTWIIIANIFGNIMLTKSITITGLDINLGIIPITTIFITTNLLIQKEGYQETNKILKSLTISSIISIIILSLISQTSTSSLTPIMDSSYNKLIFNYLFITIINTISLLISIKLNAYIYYQTKLLENKIWVSNITSMFTSQLVYNVLITTTYIVNFNNFFDTIIISIIRYIIALLIQLLGTIIIYYFTNKQNTLKKERK